MSVQRLGWVVLIVALVGHGSGTWAQTVSSAQTPRPGEFPETVPLFPLPDVVLFPHMSRPFHIFEPRYREMVSDVVQGDGYLGMVLLRPGYDSLFEGNPPVFPVGCVGEIIEAEELADGRWVIVLRGTTRFRVMSEDQSRSYRVAEVEPLDERFDAAAQAALANLRPLLDGAFTDLAPSDEPPPTDLSDQDLVNALSQFVELDPTDRQVLLEAAGPLERAEALLRMVQ